MSYQSRAYRQRNPRAHEENAKEPFFGKKPAGEKDKSKKGFFNTGITVNEPGDQYEKEADAMAASVVNKGTAKPSIKKLPGGKLQRLATPAEDEKLGTNDARMKRDKDIQEMPLQRMGAEPEKEKTEDVQKMEEPKKEEDMKNASGVQRKPQPGHSGVSPTVAASLDKSKGRGSVLPPRALKEMNSAFGVDFGNVRIHNDAEAAQLNKDLQAKAFTHGSDIYFSKNSFDAESASGKFLLAHELTHVVQQTDPAPGKFSAPTSSSIFKKGEEQSIPQNLDLPCRFGNYDLSEKTSNGIRILLGSIVKEDGSAPDMSKEAEAVAGRIAKENSLITDDAFKVKLCIIAPATTRFTLAYGAPALVLDPPDANVDTVGHEMGHALFHQLHSQSAGKTKGAQKAQNFLEGITAVFLGLKEIIVDIDPGNSVRAVWLVDPSVLTPGAKAEHPTDPDEFFASAKEAYQKDKKGLSAIFSKYGRKESRIATLGAELIALLTLALDKKSLPDKSVKDEAQRKEAAETLANVSIPGKLEDTLGGFTNYIIDMLVHPDKRPRCQKKK